MKVIDLKKGDSVEGIDLLVEKKQDGIAKNGKPYANVTLRDKTGSISGKIWEDVLVRCQTSALQEGNVISVSGAIEEYNSSLQFRITDFAGSFTSPDEFMKKSTFSIDEMWSHVVELIGTMKEPLTKYICEELILNEQFSVAYKAAPAAKAVHNAWVGGLLEHVHSLCTIAEPVIRHYQTRYCEKISRDKVLFGIMIHDAGKIIEYGEAPAFNYTTVGKFVNHMVLGPAWVYEIANRFPNKGENFKIERANLMHILAAHHGKIEWGSPVKPSSLEAILVHHLDNLDSKMLHALDFVKGKPGKIPGFSETSRFELTEFWNYSLEGK